MIRALIAGVTYVAVFFAAPLLALVGSLILALGWRAWEVIVVGFLFDLLYVPMGGFLGIPFPATLLSILIVWGFEPLRQQLLNR